MLKKFTLLACSATAVFAMHSAEININDKDLELGAAFDIGQFNDTVEPDTTFLGFNFLKGSDEHSADDADVENLYEANFLMKREVADSGVTFGIGVKANYSKVGDITFSTLPIGLEVGYTFPVEIPVYLGANLYYAPESLAFSDAESYLEYRLEVDVEVIERGSIVVGYRNIDTNVEINTRNEDVNFNKSAYFGFKFAF